MRRGDAQRRDSDSVTLGNGLLCCLGRAKENNRGDLPVTARTREEEFDLQAQANQVREAERVDGETKLLHRSAYIT